MQEEEGAGQQDVAPRGHGHLLLLAQPVQERTRPPVEQQHRQAEEQRDQDGPLQGGADEAWGAGAVRLRRARSSSSAMTGQDRLRRRWASSASALGEARSNTAASGWQEGPPSKADASSSLLLPLPSSAAARRGCCPPSIYWIGQNDGERRLHGRIHARGTWQPSFQQPSPNLQSACHILGNGSIAVVGCGVSPALRRVSPARLRATTSPSGRAHLRSRLR